MKSKICRKACRLKTVCHSGCLLTQPSVGLPKGPCRNSFLTRHVDQSLWMFWLSPASIGPKLMCFSLTTDLYLFGITHFLRMVQAPFNLCYLGFVVWVKKEIGVWPPDLCGFKGKCHWYCFFYENMSDIFNATLENSVRKMYYCL